MSSDGLNADWVRGNRGYPKSPVANDRQIHIRSDTVYLYFLETSECPIAEADSSILGQTHERSIDDIACMLDSSSHSFLEPASQMETFPTYV